MFQYVRDESLNSSFQNHSYAIYCRLNGTLIHCSVTCTTYFDMPKFYVLGVFLLSKKKRSNNLYYIS